MCSQDCMAKMKILCLNTFQVLIKDAFNRFATNLPNNLISNSTFNSNIENLNSTSINLDNESNTSKCIIDDQKPTTSFNKDDSNFNCKDCQNEENKQFNCLNNQNSQLSQLVICNLMQNLVDTINEQCIKQLGDQMKSNEKKKRKRKRKRKKSKPNDEIVNKISNENDTNKEKIKQMKQMEYFTNEQSKSIDKIKEENIYSTKYELLASSSKCKKMNKKHCNDHFKFTNVIHPVNNLNNEYYKSRIFKSNDTSFVLKNDTTKLNENLTTNNDLNQKLNTTKEHHSCLLLNLNKHNHHLKSDEKNLKRKRDNSPNYKERRRITSARKPPTFYRRDKKEDETSSSSYLTQSCSDSSYSSSYSSDDDL